VVVTPQWLGAQYRTAKFGSIAAALFAVRSLWEPEALDHFLRELPPGLVSEALSRLYEADAQETAQILSLLGIIDLVDFPVKTSGVRWPRHVLVALPETLTGITTPSMLVWLGFRAMAKHRPDRVVMPAVLGNRVLELWRLAEHKTKQSEALAQWMVAWLERCASAGWVLLPDSSRPSESLAWVHGTESPAGDVG
jgi:hypothetical protein